MATRLYFPSKMPDWSAADFTAPDNSAHDVVLGQWTWGMDPGWIGHAVTVPLHEPTVFNEGDVLVVDDPFGDPKVSIRRKH